MIGKEMHDLNDSGFQVNEFGLKTTLNLSFDAGGVTRILVNLITRFKLCSFLVSVMVKLFFVGRLA